MNSALKKNFEETNLPYFTEQKLILRDYLSIDRTILANENTFLAYIRTALTFIVAGISFVHFFGHIAIEILGWLFIPVCVAILAVGFLQYIQLRKLFAAMKEKHHSRAKQSVPSALKKI